VSDKVELKIKSHEHYHPDGNCTKSIISMLPYFRSRQPNNKFYHRIISGSAHWQDGKLSHVSVAFKCGNGGFLHKGDLYAGIPDGGLFCKRCRGTVDSSFVSGLLYMQ
jgi:hypothetical protein